MATLCCVNGCRCAGRYPVPYANLKHTRAVFDAK